MRNNRKRNIPIQFYLNEEEYEIFKEKKEKANLTTSEFLRKLVLDKKIIEMPNEDFWRLTKQIRYYGNNINQIAKVANQYKDINKNHYDENAKKVNEILVEILNAVSG